MGTRDSSGIAPPPPSEPVGAKGFWLRRAGYGLLLGAAIATLEFAYYVPLIPVSNSHGAAWFASLLMAWCGEGVLLLLAVALAERWLRPREPAAWHLVLAIVIGSVGGALLWESLLELVARDPIRIPRFIDLMGVQAAWLAVILYHVWMMLFFGGLAVAVCASERRRARMTSALRMAEIDRAITQQQLAETRLAALQARVDPDFLIQMLTRFESLYEAEPAAADRVLDDLITFLRKALVDPRNPAAATRAEARRFDHPAIGTNPVPSPRG